MAKTEFSEIKSETADKAADNFINGSFNCTEAILDAFEPDANKEPNMYSGMGTAFGGGIAGQGLMCGALAGGLMMLGRKARTNGWSKVIVRQQGQKLYQQFLEEFGDINCSELSKHNCETDNSGFDLNHCSRYLRWVTQKVEQFEA